MKKFKRIVSGFLAAVVIAGLINFAPMISRKTPGMQLYTYGDLSVYAILHFHSLRQIFYSVHT